MTYDKWAAATSLKSAFEADMIELNEAAVTTGLLKRMTMEEYANFKDELVKIASVEYDAVVNKCVYSYADYTAFLSRLDKYIDLSTQASNMFTPSPTALLSPLDGLARESILFSANSVNIGFQKFISKKLAALTTERPATVKRT